MGDSVRGLFGFRPARPGRAKRRGCWQCPCPSLVPVSPDAHDDGGETVILTLSNTVYATVGRGAATGTIENDDPMPRLAWFGRASADYVVEAIAGRWRDGESRTPQTHFTLGGRQVHGMDSLFGVRDALGAAFNPTDTGNPALMDESVWARMDRLKAEALAGGSPVESSLADGGVAGRSPPAGGGIAPRSSPACTVPCPLPTQQAWPG